MIHTIKQHIIKLNPIDFSLQLTIFFIILHFSNQISTMPLLYLPIIIFGSIGILFNDVRYSKIFWIIQTICYFLWLIAHWQSVDNHRYLWGYWLISICVALYTKKPTLSIRISSQYLIAGCMLFASIQKLISPDFLSSSFFHFSIITDFRFGFIGNIIQTDLNAIIMENNNTLELVKANVKAYKLNLGPPIIQIISKYITWYVIFIESLLAILFLIPRKKYYYWQHWVLLMFSTLYFLLPIKGFAFTLLIMGFTLLKKADVKLKSIYFFYFIYIFSIATYFNEFIF